MKMLEAHVSTNLLLISHNVFFRQKYTKGPIALLRYYDIHIFDDPGPDPSLLIVPLLSSVILMHHCFTLVLAYVS